MVTASPAFPRLRRLPTIRSLWSFWTLRTLRSLASDLPALAAALPALAVPALLGLAPSLRADPPAGTEWKLVWGDEFDGKEVDDAKWEKVGDGKRRDAFWLKKNAFLDGKGNLIVRSTKEPDGSFGCGGLRTRGRFTHSFGYYEIRCKVPDEVGTWAAFWLYDACVGKIGNGGRDGAEIDIFEAVWRDEDKVNIAIHWDGYGKEHRSWGEKVETPGVNEGFHVFGLLWTPDAYIFYHDGKELKRTAAGGVCQVPLYIKVTTEIGTWAGDIKKAKLPDDFVVDYVRVYDAVEQKAGEKGAERAEEKSKARPGEKPKEKADEKAKEKADEKARGLEQEKVTKEARTR